MRKWVIYSTASGEGCFELGPTGLPADAAMAAVRALFRGVLDVRVSDSAP
jgi:hypothetical protein